MQQQLHQRGEEKKNRISPACFLCVSASTPLQPPSPSSALLPPNSLDFGGEGSSCLLEHTFYTEHSPAMAEWRHYDNGNLSLSGGENSGSSPEWRFFFFSGPRSWQHTECGGVRSSQKGGKRNKNKRTVLHTHTLPVIAVSPLHHTLTLAPVLSGIAAFPPECLHLPPFPANLLIAATLLPLSGHACLCLSVCLSMCLCA